MVTRHWGSLFYVPPETRQGQYITLPDEEAHHLFHVMRADAGGTVRITDGNGMVYEGVILLDKRIEIRREFPEFGELKVNLILAAAVLKGDLCRQVVDTAAQLGVKEIIFFHAERCEGKLSDRKLPRFNRAAVAAIKQCGRARLPRIHLIPGLRDVLEELMDSRIIIAHPSQGTSSFPLREEAAGEGIALLVGPEGGFSDREAAAAQDAGAEMLDLGNRRLRSETAVAFGLAKILDRLGET